MRLLVVIFPAASDVCDPLFFIHERLRATLAAEGLEYLDLFDDFAGKSPYRLHAVPWVDAHLSEIAHRLAAEAIFECLLARGFVDAAYVPQAMKPAPDEYWDWIRTRMRAPHLLAGRSPPPADLTEQPAAEEGTPGPEENGPP